MPSNVRVIESIDNKVSKDLLTKYLQLKWIFAIMQQYCANEIMDRAKKHGNIARNTFLVIANRGCHPPHGRVRSGGGGQNDPLQTQTPDVLFPYS